MTDAGPLYGNQEAFQNGRVVGNVAGFAVDAVLTVGDSAGSSPEYGRSSPRVGSLRSRRS